MFNRTLHTERDAVHVVAREHPARADSTRGLSAARGILLAAVLGAVMWVVLLIVAVSAVRALA